MALREWSSAKDTEDESGRRPACTASLFVNAIPQTIHAQQ
jgi:hypothetical protein